MLKKYKNKVILSIIISLLVCSGIPFLLDCKLYSLHIYDSHLNASEWSSFNGSYIGAIIGGIATLAGVLISLKYESVKERESELKENCVIVFYDLYFGLKDLKRLYINYKNSNFKDIPLKMYFSTNWIKNVAKLSGDIEELDSIYLLYGDLETINNIVETRSSLAPLNALEDYNNDIINNLIESLSEKVFNQRFLNSNMEQYQSNVDLELEELNNSYRKILEHLKQNMK